LAFYAAFALLAARLIMSFALAFALLVLAVILVGSVQLLSGWRRLVFLEDVRLDAAGPEPSVSIVVAARNEERGIRRALEALLEQREVDFEIILVDDRSDDATAAIVEDVSRHDGRVRLCPIDTLPPGWLGKSHALSQGAALARKPWILFTDADVVLSPTALARAVRFAEREALDHLAMTPELRMPTPGSDLFGGVFILLFNRYSAPWKARDPRSRHHVGIGAFNLVRREAYDAVGGHSSIRMRPDDDMALGKILKKAGFRQDLLVGMRELSVTWYHSVREGIEGLEKNAFAGLRYSALISLGAVVALLTTGVGPWVGVLLTGGWPQLLHTASVLLTVGVYVVSTRASGANPWLAPLFPIGILIFCYVILRSATLALVRREIRWRGRTYPLDELRRNRI
jgi:glycosyltransferase involved in cell wall biosynthesis